ncbi:hypothetical protein Scep_006502 [Stephania cephalantha]|uniref:Scarecrow-like protein 28 n=1 Tax=Stephania cephalantha TaxID=152367 RepID=A0AAP0PN17_9MAGN
MLAGCSTLLSSSPRHRLRSETSPQFNQACHYQLPSMSTQRVDLPCSLPSRDARRRSQTIRPVGISVEKKPNEAKSSCGTIRQKVCMQSAIWEGRRGEIDGGLWEHEQKKSLKRFAEQSSSDESCTNRAKRKRGCSISTSTTAIDDCSEGQLLCFSQFGSSDNRFWFPQTLEVPIDSAREDTTLVLPSDVVLPSMPPLSNRWVEPISVPDTTDKEDKQVETSHGTTRANSGSDTSPESRSPGLEERSSENETGNGSRFPYPSEGAIRVTPGNTDVQVEHHCFELVSLLVACVESISSNNIPAITHFLSRLGELASPEGTTPMHRVTAYFTEALALRVARFWPHIFHIAIPREIERAEDETGTSLRLLNHLSPIPKFLHFTANEMILRAFEGKDRVHIIDFDIKQGLQWPGLFQSLASRPNPPSHVRITGIGDSKQELQETGERLAGFAAALNLPFEFHAVVDRLEDVRLWMLHVKERESVAVNCMLQLHKMLYDDSGGALRDFLGLIRSTSPTIVLMAEQEAGHNHHNLEKRVSNSLKYYSAVFDSIGFSLPLNNSPVRIKIEEMFAREIRNIVACEGSDRIERHESFGEWRKLMEHGGFRCFGVGDREMLQAQMLLKMYSCEDYKIEKQCEDGAALTLSWQEQPLYSVSAWTLHDIAGSSSSVSQPS